MINQRDNICKACKDEIVVEDLNYTIFSATETASFSFVVDSNNSFFAEIFWIKFASLSFEIDRFSRYWLKISNDILSLFFFLKLSFWRSDSISTNEMTHNNSSISSTWRQSKTKSIAKCFNQSEFFFESTQDFIDFARNANFFFSSSTTRLFLFWDEEFESHVAQKLVTSSSVIIDFSKNFVFFWTILHFFVFKEADDSTQKIDKFNSKTKTTKANKFSVDELMKTQTKKQKINTFFFSISTSFFFIDKNDTNDWFSFAKFSKVEEKIKNATNSEAESRKKIKVESQNSQSKWMSFDRTNSAKRQTTHTNFSFKLFSNSDFEISSQSSSFKDETNEKNSTKQINRISKSFQKSTFFSMMMMMMMITMITSMIVVERRISKTLL